MKGRVWMVVGVAAGLALSLGRAPYLAGAARSLADTAQRLVGSAGNKLLTSAAKHGAPHSAVVVVTALVAVALPGITALVLIVAARSTLRLRAVIAVLLVALGAAAYVYQGHGVASGTLVMALAVAGIAVAATGPLVVAPLAALAGLLCGQTLPRVLAAHTTLPNAPVAAIHQALYHSPATPAWLRVAVLIVAGVPFFFAARLAFWA
ncbi:hypothetical protein K6U06_03235 [Acidiferrimicrobium sp. IK]|uniref:hypothetical protein n=1 Tax=Acidiferrimicrobium sp. IK TaxID=2871700 RepID=UPI0021CB3D0B|nr:hypothetical protein [Acidiferrimicrobium sp. IK]MCU4183359.1 hypothetical protein [Acidiferrimicrobium sp. IK]